MYILFELNIFQSHWQWNLVFCVLFLLLYGNDLWRQEVKIHLYSVNLEMKISWKVIEE